MRAADAVVGISSDSQCSVLQALAQEHCNIVCTFDMCSGTILIGIPTESLCGPGPEAAGLAGASQ